MNGGGSELQDHKFKMCNAVLYKYSTQEATSFPGTHHHLSTAGGSWVSSPFAC